MWERIHWVAVFNTVILLIAAAIVMAIVQSLYKPQALESKNELPFYTTADPALERAGSDLYRSLQCRNCHTIWSVKSVYQAVPAPSLDGIGSLRSEAWLYRYFSAENPQEILPSRMKEKYRMPSYATLSEAERHTLAKYFSSLRVKDWYLDEAISAEQKKLTGQ